MTIIIGIAAVITFILYFLDLKKNPINTKQMVIIAMVSAISFILSLIQFIKYPQDGGISLCSMMPVMVLSLLYGRTAGLTGGIIFGLLSMLNGVYVVHPVQFLLDYILARMVLGLAGIFGNDNKVKVILGSAFAVTVSVFISFLSGVVFFGEFAPAGMGVVLYSFLYNFTTAGIEGILSIVVIALIPLERFKKQIAKDSKAA
ncbi:energy-coupled thiamine transporter ThiT [Clostridium sp. NSJ-49]|uniref:energy-coupled thiamine transporter ThiT n=1 Tax=Clostridium TaxID=1485 RepID=UPI00164B1419|nr:MULTISPECIES: energy-coupled thiamine transporter ThiT [unclassified Clostridium]MBC5624890.1 energy-coupled thiamine transporter ThiT [Clostridium sp. NSJ-49]MCD2500619.1 energy-coupled thiamine transporter ThiT [Clostridium sp. NSJ-145]MDU6340092.1 energy-coupled thiamine transporter ThiT [Clostridium sp.]